MPETKILNSINNAIQGAGSIGNRLAGGSISQPGVSLLGDEYTTATVNQYKRPIS